VTTPKSVATSFAAPKREDNGTVNGNGTPDLQIMGHAARQRFNRILATRLIS